MPSLLIHIKKNILGVLFPLLFCFYSCVELENRQAAATEENNMEEQEVKSISPSPDDMTRKQIENSAEPNTLPVNDFDSEDLPEVNPPHGKRGHDCAIPVGSPLGC